ncbi:adenylate/guanylate cyclase domain-containing protein [Rhizobiaceae sp. 2RAB30]
MDQSGTTWPFRADNSVMRWLPDINYGTRDYPAKVARRLRVLNMATWAAATFTGGFAIAQFLNPHPGVRTAAIVNTVFAALFALVPLLHRFNPLAGPLAFAALAYTAIFVLCAMVGTDSGMQMVYLMVTAIMILVLGAESTRLILFLGALAAVLIIALEVLVPPDTGIQPWAYTFTGFVVGVVLDCVILFAIIFYALRDMARAEATAEREYERSETLLLNILPAGVAERLKGQTAPVIADKFESASILFADMAGFTARAGDTSPEELVRFLNRVFTGFDRLVEKHGLEKIKTSGDAYMVVAGVPASRPDHAAALADFALDMRDGASRLRDPSGRQVPIRIGMATGPVVAGVVGTRKLFYDVWGDAVNVAARMEQTGEAGAIQVSETTYALLRDGFALAARGPVDVKGKGRLNTWTLVERKAGSP